MLDYYRIRDISEHVVRAMKHRGWMQDEKE